jgi:hypothetical protein
MTAPKFPTGTKVRVPAAVHDSQAATVVTREWGPDHVKHIGTGWVYGVAFKFGGESYPVSEEELTAWQRKDGEA